MFWIKARFGIRGVLLKRGKEYFARKIRTMNQGMLQGIFSEVKNTDSSLERDYFSGYNSRSRYRSSQGKTPPVSPRLARGEGRRSDRSSFASGFCLILYGHDLLLS